MSYFFTTRSQTMYSVMDTDNPAISLIRGGQFAEDTEIYTPQGMISKGQPFKARLTDCPANDKYVKKDLTTSPIESLHQIRAVDAQFVGKPMTFCASHSSASYEQHENRVAQAENMCYAVASAPEAVGYEMD